MLNIGKGRIVVVLTIITCICMYTLPPPPLPIKTVKPKTLLLVWLKMPTLPAHSKLSVTVERRLYKFFIDIAYLKLIS